MGYLVHALSEDVTTASNEESALCPMQMIRGNRNQCLPIRPALSPATAARNVRCSRGHHLSGRACSFVRCRLVVFVAAPPSFTGIDRIRFTGESPTVPATGGQSVHSGSVRITNRATGDAIWPRSHLRIEPAGDYYKIRWQDQYLAPIGHTPPLLRHVPDSKRPALLWEIKPVGDGFWTFINRGSGKCLEMHAGKMRQSPFSDGNEAQQWRIEPVP